MAPLADHLSFELQAMLVAATVWCCGHENRASGWPEWTVVTAEYAAFTHQRALYELFCHTSAKGPVKKARRRLRYHGAPLPSGGYDDWYFHLNTAVAHVWARDEADEPIVGNEHLKNKVADLALDLLAVWAEFERRTRVPEVAGAMRAKREFVLGLATGVASTLDAPPLDWTAPDPFAQWGDQKWWPTDF